ncbi:hypothetical protein ND748_17530, partial [Frankia sp. AiPs1]|nr:hypothetical protein [Frankia sp. AiPs1]
MAVGQHDRHRFNGPHRGPPPGGGRRARRGKRPGHGRSARRREFIPTTWAGAGRDSSGDGHADPENIDDAALAAAGYLCRGHRDPADPVGLRAAIYSYNPSAGYVRAVLAWTAGYTTAVVARAADGEQGTPDPAVTATPAAGPTPSDGPTRRLRPAPPPFPPPPPPP